MRRGARFLSCMYVLSLTLLVLFAVHGVKSSVNVSASTQTAHLWILDAGHGGPDGGCVAEDGTPESQLNLEIALRTDAVLGLLGEPTLLTREGEEDLSSADAVSISQRKVSDIRNRVAIVNTHPDSILVSLHQNTYPDESCHGATVFYNSVFPSQSLADTIQNRLKQIDSTNQRTTKPIARDIYLMNHISSPGVLIECGFLTNTQDCARIKSSSYQKQLAVAIATALASYQPESGI